MKQLSLAARVFFSCRIYSLTDGLNGNTRRSVHGSQILSIRGSFTSERSGKALQLQFFGEMALVDASARL